MPQQVIHSKALSMLLVSFCQFSCYAEPFFSEFLSKVRQWHWYHEGFGLMNLLGTTQ